MTDPTDYKMTLDPERSYMHLVFAGSMSDAIFDAFEADLKAARVGKSGKFSRLGIQHILVDARNQIILPQSDVARLQMTVERYVSAERRTAVLLSTHMLQKFQAKRITASQTDAIFQDEDEAIAWLFEGETHEQKRI